jgi:hypothetical protein
MSQEALEESSSPQDGQPKYAIWRACERVGSDRPSVAASWDKNHVLARADILAYSQIRELEDGELNSVMLKMLATRGA